MPNSDKTGPFGKKPLTGRRRGRCVNSVPTQVPQSESKSDKQKEIVYGIGHGGRPYGGGKGYCHGGPNQKDRNAEQ